MKRQTNESFDIDDWKESELTLRQAQLSNIDAVVEKLKRRKVSHFEEPIVLVFQGLIKFLGADATDPEYRTLWWYCALSGKERLWSMPGALEKFWTPSYFRGIPTNLLKDYKLKHIGALWSAEKLITCLRANGQLRKLLGWNYVVLNVDGNSRGQETRGGCITVWDKDGRFKADSRISEEMHPDCILCRIMNAEVLEEKIIPMNHTSCHCPLKRFVMRKKNVWFIFDNEFFPKSHIWRFQHIFTISVNTLLEDFMKCNGNPSLMPFGHTGFIKSEELGLDSSESSEDGSTHESCYSGVPTPAEWELWGCGNDGCYQCCINAQCAYCEH